MAQLEQMSLRWSIQNAQVRITAHKRGNQSLQLTFFPLIKCLINELHPVA